MASNTNTCKIAAFVLMAFGEGIILLIKDHVHSSINDFREKIREITNPSYAVR